MKLNKSTQSRFESKYKIDSKTGCWNWVAGLQEGGYGQFSSKETGLAHRYSYILYTGPIPKGTQIDHLCFNRKCVNPNHMEAVSPRLNVLRSNNIASKNFYKTKCWRGHDFSVDNTYRAPTGNRHCKSCRKINKTTYRQKLRSQGKAIK